MVIQLQRHVAVFKETLFCPYYVVLFSFLGFTTSIGYCADSSVKDSSYLMQI